MLFSSFIFIFCFLPIVLIGFYSSGAFSRTAGALWLILASFVFYGWWNPFFVILLVLSIAINFAISRLISATEDRPALQTWLLVGGVAFNLAALVYYKYLVAVLGFLHGWIQAVPAIDPIVMPLGISFFSFTQIGFLVDCKAGLAKERGLVNYVLFVTFFPHLIAGPILHNRDIMPQFAKEGIFRFSGANLSVGVTMFIIGLLKKTVFADPLSHLVSEGYASPDTLTLAAAWNLALCYSLQLYFDFSGYSDMAVGLARMMNVTFPMNFNSPYKAQSVIDYWRRWHITLTDFLTAYLYTPIALAVMRSRARRRVGINRAAQQTVMGFASMIALPLAVTMGLAGAWHGSGLTFLIFGLSHAIFLMINHAWRLLRPGERAATWPAIAGRVVLTYGAVLFASIFFRAPSVGAALSVLTGMAGGHGIVGPGGIVGSLRSIGGATHVLWMIGLYAIVWALPNSQQIMHAADPVLCPVDPPAWRRLAWSQSVPASLAAGIAAGIAVIALGGTTEFLYFQF